MWHQKRLRTTDLHRNNAPSRNVGTFLKTKFLLKRLASDESPFLCQNVFECKFVFVNNKKCIFPFFELNFFSLLSSRLFEQSRENQGT